MDEKLAQQLREEFHDVLSADATFTLPDGWFAVMADFLREARTLAATVTSFDATHEPIPDMRVAWDAPPESRECFWRLIGKYRVLIQDLCIVCGQQPTVRKPRLLQSSKCVIHDIPHVRAIDPEGDFIIPPFGRRKARKTSS